MKLVDSKGHYESDDETGFFFEQLKNLQNVLDEIFVNEDTRGQEWEEKKLKIIIGLKTQNKL